MHSKLYDVLQGKEANFMLPFYWLHGNHYDTIPQEVERIYNSGCRAFCVESRPHNDFVGPGWWRDMDRILQEAQKRDMQVWILDDDHFPTGNAAGHIKNFHPGKRRWDIGERHIDVAGPLKDALANLARKGVKILRMGVDCTRENLYKKVRAVFTPDVEISGQKKFLRSCHYTDGENDIYMFANENVAENADCVVTLNSVRSQKGICIDLLNDTYYKVALEDGKMPLQLAPNHSVLFLFGDVDFDSLPQKKNWRKREQADLTFKIETADADDLQTFRLLKDGVKADALFSITSLDCMPEFSGTVRYSAKLDGTDLPKNIALDLVNAGTASRLFLNGEDLGVRITKPYFYDLSGKIRKGENDLVIEVSNTLANKIRDRFSANMAIEAAGLTEQPLFVTGE